MTRCEALLPLSRGHHKALIRASARERAAISLRRACGLTLPTQSAHTQVSWNRTFGRGAVSVARLKSAKTQPRVQRTLADHHQVRTLLEDLRQINSVALGEFEKRLSDHVRFEEHELFPAVEKVLVLPVPGVLPIF